ncbi:GAF domain-containing protein [Nocardia terpenica]|uniref:GAF domain-containing protein n=1 Tax=Nocardia terpenica TaxID=455432 RepID=UPI0012E8E67B|nr:GAF domain-containing protein [Nocardia terpenica]NQE90834.1 DUF5593 domain-containing protein [Nocardia terpenica]
MVVETLTGPDRPTTILDGQNPRAFTKILRGSLGRNSAAARSLPEIIQRCADTAAIQDERVPRPGGAKVRIIAVPVAGPSGHVYATTVWIGAEDEQPPSRPLVGAIEWDTALVAQLSPDARLLTGAPRNDPPAQNTLPEVISWFDRWDDRADFLSMFNLVNPVDRWTGTATKYLGGVTHHFYIAARAHNDGSGTRQAVRAIVCDITGHQPPVNPDLSSIAARNLPIQPGHALALVDLNAGVIHEWLANSNDAIASWRHHTPLFHPDDQAQVATTCLDLLGGATWSAHTRTRLRLDPGDDWIPLQARWSRISNDNRPQALIDVTPVGPVPPSVVDRCPTCRQHHRTDGSAA